MIATIIEKFTYGVASVVLYFQHRLQRTDLSFGIIDLVFLVLFTLAYLRTPATID